MNSGLFEGLNIAHSTMGLEYELPMLNLNNNKDTISIDNNTDTASIHHLLNELDLDITGGYDGLGLNLSAGINGNYINPDMEALLIQSSQDRDTFQRFYRSLELYVVPFIFITGIVGNSVSFTVFVGTHLKRSSCHIYLASLAVADTLFLFCMFSSWGKNIGFSLDAYQGFCQVLTYLTDISRFLSVWYVVAFTVERWIVTCHPLKRDSACTPLIAKRVVIVLAVVAFIGYSFSTFTYGPSTLLGFRVCSPLPQFDRMVYIINNVDTLISLIIPTVIIVGCNIRMYYIIYKFQQQCGITSVNSSGSIQKWNFNNKNSNSTSDNKYSHRKRMLLNESSTQPPKLTMSRSSHMRATRMLIIVSSAFVVCNVPWHTARTYAFFVRELNDSYYMSGAHFLLTQKLFHIIYYINFAINFFLYSMSSRSFRNGLSRLCTKIKNKLTSCCHWAQSSLHNRPQVIVTKSRLYATNIPEAATAKNSRFRAVLTVP